MRLYFQSVLLRAGFCLCCTAALFVFAPSGSTQGLASGDLSRLRSVGSVELSPDSRRIAYTVTMRDRPGRPYGQLWIMDVATQKSVRVGGEKDSGGGPLWSPDGKSFVFQGHQGEKGGLFVARPDGSDVTFLASRSGTNSPLPGTGNDVDWSPDGKDILFASNREPNQDEFFNYDIFALKTADNSIRRLTTTEYNEYEPLWSPDGKRIVYRGTRRGVTDRETTMEDTHAWVMNADGSDRREIGSVLDNRQGAPRWAPDGSAVYFTLQER